MPNKLGPASASLYVGSAEATNAYVGETEVGGSATVPGQITGVLVTNTYYSAPWNTASLYFDAPDDGGSPITEYRVYGYDFFGGNKTLLLTTTDLDGPFVVLGNPALTRQIKVSLDSIPEGADATLASVVAVNAVGEGAGSVKVSTGW